MPTVSRRTFLKGTGGAVLALSLTRLGFRLAASPAESVIYDYYPYRGWEDLYRRKWTWDKVTWGTHLVDCYPGGCSFRVYTKDGIVWREEQSAVYPVIEDGVPDMNPRGCQKGACFSHVMYGAERLKYPLRRAPGAQRGEGKWERITWDEALSDIADAMLDAIQEAGPETIIYEFGSGEGGSVNGVQPAWRLMRLIGGTTLDSNGLTSDYNVGLYQTFGKFNFCSSIDDWFHSDLILIWHMNPLYTRIPSAHFIQEARYHGAEVVSIAPDYNASSIHSDLYVAVEQGTDAALALAMCKVILDENAVDEPFVKEQTDLPFLVRRDNARFLRQSDLEEDGRDDQFYLLNADGEVVPASRATLDLGGTEPSLYGETEVTLRGGSTIKVTPAFELLRQRLADYTPEKASAITGVRPGIIRKLARKVAAAKAVHLLQGFSICKYYHGDLMERSQALLMALTGNFGRKGTGMRGWNSAQLVASNLLKTRPGLEGFLEFAGNARKLEKRLMDKDGTLTEEMVAIETEREEVLGSTVTNMPPTPLMVPPAFYWYHHAGYKEVWNKREWNDPEMKRTFDEYMQEAVDRGWWDGLVRPSPEKTPRVYLGVAGSTLRRTRGGFKQLLNELWPKLKLIVSCDIRMSTTAYFSDIVLPAAGFYEKVDFRFPTAHINQLTFTDQAVQPPGEAKPEWEVFGLLAKKLQQRAKQREIGEYRDDGDRRFNLDDVYDVYTMHGAIKERDGEKLADEMVKDTVRVGALPEKTDLKEVRKRGIIRFTGLGADAIGLALATDIKPDETISPLGWHVQRKMPYPTHTRRIQFYIDHDWFLEAGEEFPIHKPNPRMGGDYPLTMNSGHQRWSIHSIWAANQTLLRTHRGHPLVIMNPKDAEARGVADGDEVRIFNDFESFHIRTKLSTATRPGTVIVYHAWEPYQYKNWKPYDNVVPGMIKWLHLAGGYGHLNYRRWNWVQQQVDRAIPVEVEKA